MENNEEEQCSLYRHNSFQQVWSTDDSFVGDMTNDNGIPVIISLANLRILYYLLLSKYANSPIANSSIDQFKYKVRAIIWQYGPSWEKRLDIQEKLRNLTDDELMQGSKAINNRALNDGNEPSTTSLQELDYINEQTTQQFKKGKLDGYAYLWDLLATDVTTEFLNRFAKLFNPFALPDRSAIYCYGGIEDDTVCL